MEPSSDNVTRVIEWKTDDGDVVERTRGSAVRSRITVVLKLGVELGVNMNEAGDVELVFDGGNYEGRVLRLALAMEAAASNPCPLPLTGGKPSSLMDEKIVVGRTRGGDHE